MELEEKDGQKLDLFVLLDDILKAARRHLALGLALIAMCSAFMTYRSYRSYVPVYAATASFTVKIANPLYASVSSYNVKTAEQMAATFPYILTSSVLQTRVQEHLGISSMPSISVTASSGTSIITMTVKDTDPQKAYDVLNAVILYYPEIAEFVVGSTVLVLLDESGVPTAPTAGFDAAVPAKKGALTGAALWMVLLSVLVLSKNTIHNETELAQVVNSPCMGHIPYIKVPAKVPCPLIHKTTRHSGFAESIRLLRLRVEKSMTEQGKKVLLVSSAISGEGKTTVSINLAVSLATRGKRVVLIDCNLRNPSVAKALNAAAGPGMIDYLEGSITIRDMLLPTEFENLYVISGGNGRNDSTALLNHERTARLIQAARNLFDYVILDTPPCSLLADAAELAELAEVGLMVIRQDFASRDQILDGVQRLTEGKLSLLGCTFNNVHKAISGNYGYGYGYGYGRSYGYGSRHKNDSE